MDMVGNWRATIIGRASRSCMADRCSPLAGTEGDVHDD